MLQNSITKKAENVRDVIRYLKKFNNALVVIYLDDKTIDSPLFSSHLRDIALLHQVGIKVVIVPGARKRIDEILSASKIKCEYHDGIRIADEEAMPLIKMAAFDVSNTVMTKLAAKNITAIIGNWVHSRAKGIIDGFDFQTAGEIDKLNVQAIKTVLEDGFIPIFPCIGWNPVGRPYNISSVSLAQSIAIELKADKLFFMMDNPSISSTEYQIPATFALSQEGELPAMNLEEVDEFIKLNPQKNQITSLLKKAKDACNQGVTRVHLVDGNLDGVLLSEIFSDLGSGTMIYKNNYGHIRDMERQDVAAVLSLMKPFVQDGKLLERSEQDLLDNLNDYIVYELDGAIRACAALHLYDDLQAEIAAVAVDESFGNMGIGPKLIKTLLQKAQNYHAKSVFILTTQAIDWFEKLGFVLDSVDSLPEERKRKWNAQRNSKVYRKKD